MLTMLLLYMAPDPAPPPNVPPATTAANIPEKSSTLFRLQTVPLAISFATPMSPTSKLVTVNGYFSP